jgi:hypothetical protein
LFFNRHEIATEFEFDRCPDAEIECQDAGIKCVSTMGMSAESVAGVSLMAVSGRANTLSAGCSFVEIANRKITD